MERFSNQYKEFLDYMMETFPLYKKYFVYKETSHNLASFVELVLPYIEDISIRNVDAFKYKHKDMQIVRGLRFRKLLEDKKMSPRVLENIWRSLHNLYIIAYNTGELKKMVKKREDLSSILENHNILVENIMLSGHVIVDDKETSDSTEEEEISDEEAELRKQFERGDKVDDKADDKPQVPPNLENMFEGSVIGKMAKEMADSLKDDVEGLGDNPNDIFSSLFNPSPDGNNKIANIMGKIQANMENKMKNGELNQEQLMAEAQQMMGSLGPMLAGAGGGDMSNMMQQMMGGMMGGGGGGRTNRKQRRKNQRGRR